MTQEVCRESPEAFSHSSGGKAHASSSSENHGRLKRDLQSVVAEPGNGREIAHTILPWSPAWEFASRGRESFFRAPIPPSR
jgi:hypothetical protein